MYIPSFIKIVSGGGGAPPQTTHRQQDDLINLLLLLWFQNKESRLTPEVVMMCCLSRGRERRLWRNDGIMINRGKWKKLKRNASFSSASSNMNLM
jgi:hypothetical protein